MSLVRGLIPSPPELQHFASTGISKSSYSVRLQPDPGVAPHLVSIVSFSLLLEVLPVPGLESIRCAKASSVQAIHSDDPIQSSREFISRLRGVWLRGQLPADIDSPVKQVVLDH